MPPRSATDRFPPRIRPLVSSSVVSSPAVALPVAVLLAVLAACLAAPFYARHVARTDPFRSAIDATVVLDGHAVPVLADNTEGLGLGVTPIGPGWRGRYLLGADTQGRDLAARLLYAGRLSLAVSGAATLLCLGLGGAAGALAGFAGGAADMALSRALDLVWAFPSMLLAICLSLALAGDDLRLGPWRIGADSLSLPVLVLGIVFVPYVARPLRAEMRALRRRDFMRAARALGVGPGRMLWRHAGPFALRLLGTFAPLVMGLCLMTGSALSFLSIGIQAPAADWGTLIADGQALLAVRPLAAVAPGCAIAATVLSLNLLGDALRDAWARGTRGEGR